MSKRELLARTLEQTGMGRLLSATLGRWRGLLVFNYHRVGDSSTSPFDRALWSASQDEFDQQVEFLKSQFDVIRIADLPEVVSRADRRAVLITFDDGYRDNFELALPVLRRHGVPATFFITSGFMDQRNIAWWDEIAWMVRRSALPQLPSFPRSPQTRDLSSPDAQEAAIKQLLLIFKKLPEPETGDFLNDLAIASGAGRCPPDIADGMWMTWDMVRQLHSGGMDLGGHTVSHPVLANADIERQRREIVQSKQRVEELTDCRLTAFSYPVGQRDSFSEETKTLLREAGYDWAFSFYGGFCSTSRNDRFNLPRVGVSPYLTRDLFRSTARLPGIFA